jgi:hypothetical protein
LAKRCQAALDERLSVYLRANNPDGVNGTSRTTVGWNWFADRSGWQDRDAKLFSLAGEVAGIVAK